MMPPRPTLIQRILARSQAAWLGWTWLRFGSPAEDRPDVRAAIDGIERDAEQFLARVRLGIVAVLGLALGGLAISAGRVSSGALLVFGLYVALSLAALVLTHAGRFPQWLPWALTTLDVVVVVAVVRLGPYASMLPGAYVASVTTTWAVFLLLSLAALRYDGRIVLYATALFAIGLSAIIVFADSAEDTFPASETWPHLFSPGRNLLRITLLVATGVVLAIAVFRARMTLVRAVKSARERGNLARHFAKPVAALVAAQGQSASAGRQQLAAVMFADIRGFTTRSEKLTPTELASFLTAFRRRATQAIERHGGIVDKFMGDAVMAVFGVPDASADDAYNALAGATALLAEMKEWNDTSRSVDLDPVRVGIGVHHGLVFAGALGDDERLEFTVIGDAVNVAQRLEELTRSLDVDLLASGNLLLAAGLLDGREREYGLRSLGPTIVRGRAERVALYGLAA
jgi:adenylate cyclase